MASHDHLNDAAIFLAWSLFYLHRPFLALILNIKLYHWQLPMTLIYFCNLFG